MNVPVVVEIIDESGEIVGRLKKGDCRGLGRLLGSRDGIVSSHSCKYESGIL